VINREGKKWIGYARLLAEVPSTSYKVYKLPKRTGRLWVPWSGRYKHWTGLLEWITGLEYWTDIFLVFTYTVVG